MATPRCSPHRCSDRAGCSLAGEPTIRRPSLWGAGPFLMGRPVAAGCDRGLGMPRTRSRPPPTAPAAPMISTMMRERRIAPTAVGCGGPSGQFRRGRDDAGTRGRGGRTRGGVAAGRWADAVRMRAGGRCLPAASWSPPVVVPPPVVVLPPAVALPPVVVPSGRRGASAGRGAPAGRRASAGRGAPAGRRASAGGRLLGGGLRGGSGAGRARGRRRARQLLAVAGPRRWPGPGALAVSGR